MFTALQQLCDENGCGFRGFLFLFFFSANPVSFHAVDRKTSENGLADANAAMLTGLPFSDAH